MSIDKQKKIKVLVAGAAGRMGQAAIKSILLEPDLELVGVTGRKDSDLIDKDILEICNLDLKKINQRRPKNQQIKELDLKLESNLQDSLQRTQPEVFLDLSVPNVVYENAKAALNQGINVVSGATGLSYEDSLELGKKAEFASSGILVAPNFSIGALLMIHFAKIASKYFNQAEIIETHHDQKVDAPSGTSLKTAREMSKTNAFFGNLADQQEKSNQSARGLDFEKIRIHSLRLPGFLAHQNVIFGSQGQALSIKHDTFDRDAFMPGIILSIKEVIKTKGLTYGLENILKF